MTDETTPEPEGADFYNPFDPILKEVKGLDPERFSLLLNGALTQTASMLAHAQGYLADNVEASSLVALARNVLNFANILHDYQHTAHEDWTRTGDRQVDSIWQSFIELMERLAVNVSDIPDEVKQRIKDGTATDADFDSIVEGLSAKTGVPASKFKVDPSVGRAAVKATVKAASEKDEDEEPQTGLYL